MLSQYVDLELQHEGDPQVSKFLETLVHNNTEAMEKNLEKRFQEDCPVLQAFSVFDPTCLPKPTDPNFWDYGDQYIAEQLKMDKDQTLAEWKNLKYMLADWDLPTIFKGEGISPTAYALKRDVREQAVLNVNLHYIVAMATVCLCQPLSNAMVERGASAVKRLKTRLRSRLKNDKLSALLHIAVNGPQRRSEECKELITAVEKQTGTNNYKQSKLLKVQTLSVFRNKATCCKTRKCTV